MIRKLWSWAYAQEDAAAAASLPASRAAGTHEARQGCYPGSFDPITHGHIHMIEVAARQIPQLVVAIGFNPAKDYLLFRRAREEICRRALAHLPNVRVDSFSGLLAHYVAEQRLHTIFRGVRNFADVDGEQILDLFNKSQATDWRADQLLIPADPHQTYISSSALKAACKEQANVRAMAPPLAKQAVECRQNRQYFYGVTGPSGAGKGHLCQRFAALAAARDLPLLHVDLDGIGHDILGDRHEPMYRALRQRIAGLFGPGTQRPDGSIDRARLGAIVFGDPERLAALNAVVQPAILLRLARIVAGKQGIILLDGAILPETDATYLCNHQVLLVEAPTATIAARLRSRSDRNPEQIERRAKSQFTAAEKSAAILHAIAADRCGSLQRLQNDDTLDEATVAAAFDFMLTQIDLFGELRIPALLRGLGVPDPEAAYADLHRRYGGPDRLYHSLFHIVDGLNQIPAFAPALEDPAAFLLAWLYHDAVYEPLSQGNEEASARLLLAAGGAWGLAPNTLAAAAALIRATDYAHAPGTTPAQGATPGGAGAADARLMQDLDFSILGSGAAIYARYRADLRREYATVPERDWRLGRRAFLDGVAARPEIFRTAAFRHLEDQARCNLALELQGLDPT
jgi:pantetheine-phosphate adenylyltransferase